MFVRKGYAATSTRDIADAAGIKQPSLYSHFKTKSEILLEILLRTIDPSLARAEELAADDSFSSLERVMALIEFDVRLLTSSSHNKGILYLFPELDEDVYATFRVHFDRLRGLYRTLIVAAVPSPAESGDLKPEDLAAVVFSMVEAVALRRTYESDFSPEAVASQTTAAIRQLLTQGRQPG